MTEPEENDDLEPEGAEQLGDAGKRALDAMKAKLKAERARIKELEPLAERARAADDAAKTQAQKDAEARAAVERERDEARLTLMRRDAADEAGLPKSWADRLRGNTPAELLADAKALARDLGPEPQQTTPRPVPDLRSGALPASSAQPLDGNEWVRSRIRNR